MCAIILDFKDLSWMPLSGMRILAIIIISLSSFPYLVMSSIIRSIELRQIWPSMSLLE